MSHKYLIVCKMVLLYHFQYAMHKRLYFESLEELSHKDTWVHYYFKYYKSCLNEMKFFNQELTSF
jgi:hypothetical protein